ncbi:MAG: SprT family zinc-dependent metalloprotease [bacterium]|nr:SprT family zinc-dependent metalloprotease [bacterium]
MQTFNYGKHQYDYQLLRLERKTLSLTIFPDLSIVVRCPLLARQERIEKFLQKKWLWLEKQIGYFKKYHFRKSNKEYVSGESFLYLGRQYKLIVRAAKADMVSLNKGVLVCHTADSVKNNAHTKRLLDKWCAERAKSVLMERYDEVFTKFDYTDKPRLVVKKMDRRWGSFVRGKSILLNPLLIRASKDCIDYVITHELCHVKHRNHTKAFYKLLGVKYPKWEAVKEKLEMRLI